MHDFTRPSTNPLRRTPGVLPTPTWRLEPTPSRRDVMRRGIVLLSTDAAAAVFIDAVVEDLVPSERKTMTLSSARTCIAVLGGAQRRRMLVVDGNPTDLSLGRLLEAVRMLDPELPIVLVRPTSEHPLSPGFGAHVVHAPLIRLAIEQLLAALLRTGPQDKR
jgi:hypothetical protein